MQSCPLDFGNVAGSRQIHRAYAHGIIRTEVVLPTFAECLLVGLGRARVHVHVVEQEVLLRASTVENTCDGITLRQFFGRAVDFVKLPLLAYCERPRGLNSMLSTLS